MKNTLNILKKYWLSFSLTIIYLIIIVFLSTPNLLMTIIFILLILYDILITCIHSNKSKKRVVFISSTGGHLSELLQLKSLMQEYDSYLITEKTKSNLTLKKKYKNVYYLVYGTKKDIFKYIFKFSYNIIKSFYYFIKIRPKVIVTTGTHTAVPMCYIAKLFRSKIIYIETFANSHTKTVTGRLIYPIADTFVVQWESMLELYPKAICAGWIY